MQPVYGHVVADHAVPRAPAGAHAGRGTTYPGITRGAGNCATTPRRAADPTPPGEAAAAGRESYARSSGESRVVTPIRFHAFMVTHIAINRGNSSASKSRSASA
jgi:hypothetical protein